MKRARSVLDAGSLLLRAAVLVSVHLGPFLGVHPKNRCVLVLTSGRSHFPLAIDSRLALQCPASLSADDRGHSAHGLHLHVAPCLLSSRLMPPHPRYPTHSIPASRRRRGWIPRWWSSGVQEKGGAGGMVVARGSALTEVGEDECGDHEVEYCAWSPLARAPAPYHLWDSALPTLYRAQLQGESERKSRSSRCAPAT
ncbi:hypothetical protein B0H13DRAFT_2001783 [Mycena leptocephala]|nr:hypothetical protein B0H13DRAFT_2001783 [Mycena leptocephala]